MLNTSNDQRKLLPNFEHLFATTAQAPGGVARLRELILTLAVQGKLVAQDPSDEPASELLKKIRAEKDRLIAEGKIKKDKPLPEITDEEKPFELPVGWEVCRLGDIFLSIKSGGTPSKNNPSYWDGEIPWASVKDLKFGEPIKDTQDKITAEGLEAGSQLAAAGSILICTRMGLGKIGEALVDVAINQDLKAVQLGSEINKNYFINFFKTLSLTGSGMTVAGIKQDELLSLLLPLPPEKEQSRIVARVEELMRLCDALEEKGRLEHTQHQQLLQAMLDSLTQTTDAQELARHWQRLAQHFDLLIDHPEAVDALEQTILQLAVRGLLVPQDPSDEPASELVEKAKVNRFADSKKSAAPLVADDEKLFGIPEHWVWERLGNLFDGGSGSTPLRNRNDYFENATEFWIKTTDLNLDIVYDGEEKINIKAVKECNLKYFEAGTVCIAMYGGAGTIGKSGILGVRSTINQSVFALPPIEFVNSKYLHIFAMAVRNRWMSFAAGLRKDPNINGQIIKNMPFPVPPLAEQSRIVARVTELRALCQQLRDKLTQARTTQTQLAQAWVAQVAG